MVKKLLKQEYKYYIRTLIFILPAILLLGIFTRVIQFFQIDHYLYYLAFGGLIVIFVIASAAAIISAEVLAIVRFYKNLYSTEGYLTFTLPVNNHHHLISKLIAHICSVFVTVLVVVVAWIIAFIGTEGIALLFTEISNALAEIDFAPYVGHIILFSLEFIIMLCVGAFSGPLVYYTCISIGQLAKKNKILLAIGAYYAYTVIVQIAGTVFTMVFTVVGVAGGLDWLVPVIEAHPVAFAHVFIWISIVVSAGINVLLYYINIRIMNNKLNLE